MKSLKIKNIIWNSIKKLANLNFSILLLLLIASISILGTIIEQDQEVIYYQINYPIDGSQSSLFNWKIITFFGLNQVYTTWWFLFIIMLFAASLTTCTFSRQLPSLKNSRNWKFLQKIHDSKKLENFKRASLSNIIYSLNLQKYYIFHKNNKLYAYKGLIGRIAPIFVHISIIMTLVGSLIGLFGGFTAQEIIPNREIFHIKNIINSGFKSYLPTDLFGRIDNFTIEYNEDNSIKQFFSQITLLNSQGINLIQKQISVNKPLKFKGLTFYQTDWKINGLRLTIEQKFNIQKELKEIRLNNQKLWSCNFPIDSQKNIIIIVKNLKEKISIYNSDGDFIQSINLHEKINLGNIDFTIDEIITCTGLQIKTDPGLFLIYTAFLFLIISVFSSYLSYSQIWVNSKNNRLLLAGSTNRAVLKFEEELILINKRYVKYTFLIYKK